MDEKGIAKVIAKEMVKDFEIYNFCGKTERETATEEEVAAYLGEKFEEYCMISHKTWVRD